MGFEIGLKRSQRLWLANRPLFAGVSSEFQQVGAGARGETHEVSGDPVSLQLTELSKDRGRELLWASAVYVHKDGLHRGGAIPILSFGEGEPGLGQVWFVLC